MKNAYISTLISGLLVLSATRVYGSVIVYTFQERAQKSDLIVQGVLQKQANNPDYHLRDLRSFRKKSVLEVVRVYKGNVAEEDIITVFSHMNFICDTSRRLAEGQRYVLMLKRYGSGFADVNHGRGMWEIVTLEPEGQFVVGDLFEAAWGKSHEEFQNDLVWALSEIPSWPKRPAISAQQAKKIALEALSHTSVDLDSFELTRQKLLNMNTELIGIAYKGDPMWRIDWVRPKAPGQSARPPGSFVFCYIHAHTGKYHIGSRFYCKSPLARNARLFLKSYRGYRQIYSEHADNVKITQLTEEEFRTLLPRLKDIFLTVKPSYPAGTTFLRVEFPGGVQLNPVAFVFDAGGRVDFAGIMNPKVYEQFTNRFHFKQK
jgi:hypothetical protein